MHDWVLGYGVAIAGMIGEVAAMAVMANRTINHVAANQQMMKLVVSNNLPRALRLCRGAGRSTYLRSLEAAIVGGTSAGTTDRATLTAAVNTAFDADAGPRGATYQRTMILGLLACVVALVGCGIVVAAAGIGRHSPWGPALAIALCSVFIGAGFAMKIGKFKAAAISTRHHLLPSIVEALASGSARP